MSDYRYLPSRHCSLCYKELPDHEAHRVPIAHTDHILCITCYQDWVKMSDAFRLHILENHPHT